MLYMIFIKKYLNLLITTLFFGASYKKKLCVKHKASMIVNLLTPRLAPAASDLLCPAGRSGCSCHVMAVIWKLEMSRNNEMKNQCDNDVPCAT